MARMAFKVNDNAKKIVQCLNHFTKNMGFVTMNGNTNENNYYCIEYNPETYKITDYVCTEYLVGDEIKKDTLPPFMDLPLDIQIEAVKRSQSKSLIPFLKCRDASFSGGGFDWDETPEGWDFWNSVLVEGDTDLFYKQFKSKKHESRLQEQESPLRGGSREFTSGVRSRVNKARVTVSSLGYKEVVGRG
jgi:hypothetical protein